jgi:phosphopantothenoylcysteine decarboxylase/phosphopantothenate--cysteine ligase
MIKKNIILGVTGGVAAYKALELARLLIKAGAAVQVVMTASAQEFISPLSFQAITGRAVRTDLFDTQAEQAMSHIELARWADCLVIAPATANTIAKLAHGFADDLLTTLCLATTAPIYIAPAMNRVMWSNPMTQRNVKELLSQYNHDEKRVKILGPASGEQACGEWGEGRLVEPEEIIAALNVDLAAKPTLKNLVGKTVLITAGPTREPIDPARCLTNFSSGKMGYALAKQAKKQGARVILVSGPCSLVVPEGVECYAVETALQMDEQVQALITQNKIDIFIGAAAVSDYRVKTISTHKIKKLAHETMQLELIKNPDILARVSESPHRPRCVLGFAAETENLVVHGQEKLARKQLDWIVINSISTSDDGSCVFASDYNEAQMRSADGRIILLERASKSSMAEKIVDILAEALAAHESPCYDPCPQS